MISACAERVAELAEMNTATWARELRAVAFSRVGDLVGPDGMPLPVHLLPAHVQAAIASMKVTTHGDVIEYKFWVTRHLGLFDRDSAQTKQDIHVRVELVG